MNCDKAGSGARASAVAAVAVVALAGLAGLGAVCDVLFGEDRQPPDCTIVQPTDSAAVSGIVTVRADAWDSSGVSEVRFYVDGVRVGTDLVAPYTATWDASSQPDRSWHTMFCLAFDGYGNVGSSDTIAVQVWLGGERDVLHGAFRLDHNYYWVAGFAAAAGDTLAGDMRVVSGAVLSRLAWLDAANYREFSNGRAHSAVFEATNQPALAMRQPVPAADSFYLVFLNTSGARVEVWARFTLE